MRGMRTRTRMAIAIWLCIVAGQIGFLTRARAPLRQPGILWQHLSSANGDLPVPGKSREQTGAIVADLDKDGQVSLLEAFLIASRRTLEFYKVEGRIATEHALIDDNGDGLLWIKIELCNFSSGRIDPNAGQGRNTRAWHGCRHHRR